MPTPKEQLASTVAATKDLFKRAKQLREVDAAVRKMERQEEALTAAKTSGVTAPEE